MSDNRGNDIIEQIDVLYRFDSPQLKWDSTFSKMSFMHELHHQLSNDLILRIL